jgi:hypothetical protein
VAYVSARRQQILNSASQQSGAGYVSQRRQQILNQQPAFEPVATVTAPTAPNLAMLNQITEEDKAEIARIEQEQWEKEHPVRSAIINNPVSKAITKASQFTDVAGESLRSALLGGQDTNPDYTPTTGSKVADETAKIIGNIEQFFLPTGAGTLGGVANKASNYLATKVLSKAPSAIAKSGVAQRVVQAGLESLPYTAQQVVTGEVKSSDIPKQGALNVAYDVGAELAFAGAGTVLDAIIKRFKKPIQEAIETTAGQAVKKGVKASTGTGAYKVKNVAYDKAMKEYEDAITEIQNHFKTNELTVQEQNSILSELGIDLNDIVNKLDNAEKTGTAIDNAERMRMKRVAGLITDKQNDIANKIRSQKTVGENLKTAASEIKQTAEEVAKLPDSPYQLQRVISQMEEQQKKGIKINLQLFAEAKKKLEEISKVYKNTLTNTDIIPQEVKDILDPDDFRYSVKTEIEQIKEARGRIAQNAQKELDKIKDLTRTEYNETDINIGMELLHDLSNGELTPQRIKDIKDLAKGVTQAGRTQGRGIQAFAKYTRTPEGMVAAAERAVDKIKEQFKKKNPRLMDAIVNEAKKRAKKGESYQDVLDSLMKKNKIPVLDDEDIKQIVEGMQRYDSLPEGWDKQAQWYKVMQIISNKMPSSVVEKYRGLQRIAYLFNPKTILVRSPLGNVIMGMMETVKDAPGAVIDKLVSLKTGRRTTTAPTLKRLSAQGKGFVEGAQKAVKDIKAGVDTSPMRGRLEMPRKKVFSQNNIVGRGLNKLDQWVGNALALGDRPFYQAAYNDRIAQLSKLGEITQDSVDEAHLYALERVFQDDSGVAKFFRRIKTPPENAPEGVKTAWGFVANSVLPFAQTPASILNKLVEYTPGGFIKAFGHLGMKAGKGTFNQKYFVDNLARSITGTGIFALGYVAAKNGVLSGKPDKDKDIASVERLMGINPYSIKLGDTTYTIDWAQPSAAMLAMGADAFFSGRDKDNVAEQLAASAEGAGNTFFNQSMLQNLTDVFGGYSPIVGVGKSILDNASLTTPTIGAQTAKTIDPYVRETYSPNPTEQFVNQQKARVPGASMTLPEKLDVLGRPTEQSQGRNVFLRALEQYLSPGYVGDTSKATPELKEVYRLYKQTGEKSIFPKVAPKYFTDEGNKVELTTEEYTQWQRDMGQYAADRINRIINSKNYRLYNDDKKALAIKNAVDDSYDYAKKLYKQRKR